MANLTLDTERMLDGSINCRVEYSQEFVGAIRYSPDSDVGCWVSEPAECLPHMRFRDLGGAEFYMLAAAYKQRDLGYIAGK